MLEIQEKYSLGERTEIQHFIKSETNPTNIDVFPHIHLNKLIKSRILAQNSSRILNREQVNCHTRRSQTFPNQNNNNSNNYERHGNREKIPVSRARAR